MRATRPGHHPRGSAGVRIAWIGLFDISGGRKCPYREHARRNTGEFHIAFQVYAFTDPMRLWPRRTEAIEMKERTYVQDNTGSN